MIFDRNSISEEENIISLTVEPDSEGKRIDVFIAERCELTRSAVQKLIKDGAVFSDGKPALKSTPLKAGGEIYVTLPPPRDTEVAAENIPLDIAYEDADLLVVNKPKGMVVHPAAGNPSGTLVNALLYHCGDSLSGIGGVIRPGIVHRIDKDTSGLLVVAKNDRAHVSLSEQISSHTFLRQYEAVAVGGFRDDEGRVEAPIGRHPVNRKRMAVVAGGKYAATNYSVKGRFGGYTHICCRLETGRTHQIRVHMSHIGHPLFCDELYGGGRTELEKKNKALIEGQCLHAKTLGFIHPITGKEMFFESELPDYFCRLLEKLEKL